MIFRHFLRMKELNDIWQVVEEERMTKREDGRQLAKWNEGTSAAPDEDTVRP